MDPLRRVVRNSSALVASNVLVRGLSFFYVLIAARYLGAKGYGLLSFALSFCSIFKIIVDLGFAPLIVKDVARDRSLTVPYVRNIVNIKLYLLIVTFALLAVAVRLLGYSGNDSIVIYALFAYVVLYSFADIGYAVMRAFEEIQYVALGEVLSGGAILAGFAVLAYKGLGVVAFSAGYAVAGGGVLLYAILVTRRIMVMSAVESPADRADISRVALLKESLPFALIIAFNVVLYYLDSVMLGIFRTQEEVGIYGVAYKSAMILNFVPLAVHNSLVPVISRLFGEGSDAVTRNVGRFFRFNFVIGFPMGVGGTLLAWRIIPMVFGRQYEEASLIFAVLIWSLVLTFMRFPFNTFFESTDRQSMLARFFTIAVILNIILNAILIPLYGMKGAASATVMTDLVLVMVMMYFGIRAGACSPASRLAPLFLKVILSAAAMGFACMLALRVGVLLSVLVGILVYSALVWTVSALEKDDKLLIRRVFGL